LKKTLREIYFIGLFDALPLLRDPMMLFIITLIAFLPVLFLFIFAGGQAALPALVGAIVLSLAFVGLTVAQSVYFNKHWFRFQDIYVASPVSPISYALGLAFATFLYSLPALAFSFAILAFALPAPPLAYAAVIATSLLLWLAMILMGFTLGLSTKNVKRANALPQVLGFVLGFLPPVYYPLDRLPPFLQPVALLIPSTHAAQLSKHYFGLLTAPLPPEQILLGWGYLLGFVAVMALFASRRAHWVDP